MMPDDMVTTDIEAAASPSPASTSSSVPLTKYERARLVAARVGELEANAAATVSLVVTSIETLFDIATREVAERTLDTNLKRFLPGGHTETLHLSSFSREDEQN